jgi:hypothetical protein
MPVVTRQIKAGFPALLVFGGFRWMARPLVGLFTPFAP